jgi:hypothetical protein
MSDLHHRLTDYITRGLPIRAMAKQLLFSLQNIPSIDWPKHAIDQFRTFICFLRTGISAPGLLKDTFILFIYI